MSKKKAKQASGAETVMLMKVALWPVKSLIPYAGNSRVHTEEKIDRLVRSIQALGTWTNPIIANSKTKQILAGHARLRAALKMGLAKVPVLEVGHLTEAQQRAYVIADNKLTVDATWDMETLKAEFGAIKELGADPTMTGFSLEEIESIETGWAPDFGSGDKADGEHDEGLRGRVVVTCNAQDKPDVVSTLQRALKDSGIEGVEVVA